MPYEPTDSLWSHFVPLWTDLRGVTSNLLLAGGYGLFLKQQWLLLNAKSGSAIRTLVPLVQWNNTVPRVTKDLDFIAELKLIASPNDQRQINDILSKHGFEVVAGNERWQFSKKVAQDQDVVVDFHAPMPIEKRDDLRFDTRRVKPKPSLGSLGIQGRTNPEAVGCDLHPFHFKIDGVDVAVPNPVTWSIMKMVAMRDRWRESQDSEKTSEKRTTQLDQAVKHAQDACRVMAMVTREENDSAGDVLEAIREMPVFNDTCRINGSFFQNEDGWGRVATRTQWTPDDFLSIKGLLSSWFSEKQRITD